MPDKEEQHISNQNWNRIKIPLIVLGILTTIMITFLIIITIILLYCRWLLKW